MSESDKLNASNRHELLELCDALVDGRLDAAGEARLGERLATSREARDLYLAYCELHAELSLVAPATNVASNAAVAPVAPFRPATSSGRRLLVWSAAAIAPAVGVLLALSNSRNESDDGAAAALAVIASADEARWSADSSVRPAPNRLAAGTYGLEHGRARLTTDGGVTIDLAAPVRFELLDAKAMRVVSGEIAVAVTAQGIGFRVITPSADVIDLGTAFSVRVDDGGSTEVHVSQGLVVARAVDSDGVVQVKRSEAARFEALSGDISAIPFRAPAEGAEANRDPADQGVHVRPLPPGARVVFLGDRTTDRETHLLWIADAVRPLPGAIRPRLFNVGVTFPLSFDEEDFRLHVAPLRPTHAVLEFGSEIAAELDEARTPAKFRRDIERLIARLREDGVEPILETGFPLGPWHPMSQGRVDEYNAMLRVLADRHRLTLVDVDHWFRTASLPHEDLVVPSGLFPATAGHREIAACLLATWDLPKLAQADSPTTPLLPGAITAWRYHFVERGTQLRPAEAAALRPDATWTALALPQRDDALAELTADKQHLVGYRDRRRGFATNLYGTDGNQVQAYAEVEADEARDAVLNVGAGVQSVWLNGKPVLAERRYGGWHAGKGRIPVRLSAGTNRIVVEARGGFFVSLTDTIDWALP